LIKWSFSGLKQYVNCPKQYHEVKVLQNFQTQVSKQMQYGTDVHKALEDYTRDEVELPANYKRFQALVDTLMEIPGEKYFEYKMALTEGKSPCDFYSKDYWVRGIADLLIVDGDTAFIVDYKTGSNRYPDPKQLKLMALMTFAIFPGVTTVNGGLLFVVHNSFVPETYNRKDTDSYWHAFLPDIQRLQMSFDTGNWSPNPTKLCGWCPVKTCNFYSEK